jgi:two-component system cell cycle sensor histidine kinase/response regulator CckA
MHFNIAWAGCPAGALHKYYFIYMAVRTLISPLHLLHLEDNIPDSELISEVILQEWPDCRINRVQTRGEFLAALRKNELDLILSDFTMPGFNGLSALALAGQLCPETPFIFLSGTIGEDAAVEALKNGATDYVIKDRMSRLVPVIRRALQSVRESRIHQETERKLRVQAELLDKARDAICVIDTEGRITYSNHSAGRLFGWTGTDVQGQLLSQLFARLGCPSQAAAAHQALKSADSWTGELRIKGKDGEQLVVESRWTPVRDAEGQTESVLIINTDITEQDKLEKQFLRAQRLESIGTLAGGIAHDLNNTLTPIIIAVDMLRNEITDQRLLRLINVMDTSAHHGASLIRQVLTFARGAGTAGERVPVQPRDIIRDVVELIRETLPRSINISSNTAADLHFVKGNATQLSQVFMNLCVNARDAMPEGGQLSIFAQNVVVDEMTALANPGAQSGPHVYIAIADSGCGIPPDIIDRIFDPFFTTKNQGKGTGLGLATVLGIVKAHGGFLSVKSAVAQGTEFQIYLPAVFEFAEAEPKTPANAVPLRGGGETLLVIDDEACVREIVGDTLEAYGYRVILAPDGLSGIALYRQHASEIDAVLTDMMMPNMQGAEVIAALHGIKPDLPIVAMSGLIESQKFGLTPKAGKLEILKKPMNTEDLLRSIQSLLKYPGTIVR